MDYSWKDEKFDSEIFEFRVAKILKLKSSGIGDLISDFKKNKIDYATFRVGAREINLIHLLESAGFVLVDGLITLKLDLSDISAPYADKHIRSAFLSDFESLSRTIKGLFSTRIQNDPLISKKKSDKFFTEWLKNSIKGEVADEVLIWVEKTPIAFATLKKSGQIQLVGVSKKYQGRGIAKKLLTASLVIFKKWGLREAIIETQVDNIGALRAYQGVGFKITHSHLTFRWSSL